MGMNFINKGVGTAARMGRGAIAGGLSGALGGVGDGDTPDKRALGAVTGAGWGALTGGAITGVG